MLKRSLLFLAILLIMILVIPQIAEPSETPEDSRADGVLFPHRISVNHTGGSATYIFKEVKHIELIDDSMFVMPE